jgi:hypothetical protein
MGYVLFKRTLDDVVHVPFSSSRDDLNVDRNRDRKNDVLIFDHEYRDDDVYYPVNNDPYHHSIYDPHNRNRQEEEERQDVLF